MLTRPKELHDSPEARSSSWRGTKDCQWRCEATEAGWAANVNPYVVSATRFLFASVAKSFYKDMRIFPSQHFVQQPLSLLLNWMG